MAKVNQSTVWSYTCVSATDLYNQAKLVQPSNPFNVLKAIKNKMGNGNIHFGTYMAICANTTVTTGSYKVTLKFKKDGTKDFGAIIKALCEFNNNNGKILNITDFEKYKNIVTAYNNAAAASMNFNLGNMMTFNLFSGDIQQVHWYKASSNYYVDIKFNVNGAYGATSVLAWLNYPLVEGQGNQTASSLINYFSITGVTKNGVAIENPFVMNTYLKGDATGDSLTDSVDESKLIEYNLGNPNATWTPIQWVAADIDESGIVDMGDTTMMAKYLSCQAAYKIW